MRTASDSADASAESESNRSNGPVTSAATSASSAAAAVGGGDGGSSSVSARELSRCTSALRAVPHFAMTDIMRVLPHRYPFLLVDKVVQFTPGECITTVKNVTANEPHFTGHFPGNPIMPGVLQLEALAQSAGLIFLQPPMSDGESQFYFAGVDKVRWRRPVLPGDCVLMQVRTTSVKKRFGIVKCAGSAYVDGEMVLEGELTFAIGK